MGTWQTLCGGAEMRCVLRELVLIGDFELRWDQWKGKGSSCRQNSRAEAGWGSLVWREDIWTNSQECHAKILYGQEKAALKFIKEG